MAMVEPTGGLPTKSSELRYWGVGFVDRYKGFFSDMTRAAPESDRGKLMHAFGPATTPTTPTGRRATTPPIPRRACSRACPMFISGSPASPMCCERQGAQHMIARELAMERGKAYADVDPRIQRLLRLYGIEEAEWKALHGAERTTGRTIAGTRYNSAGWCPAWS